MVLSYASRARTLRASTLCPPLNFRPRLRQRCVAIALLCVTQRECRVRVDVLLPCEAMLDSEPP